MTTYVYETIPAIPGVEPRRFEVRQSMKDAPLKADPATGEPVRRVISGGFGFVAQKSGPGTSSGASGGCGCGRCGCGCSN
ncbi:FmdB family zinc ribbon protein [Opitutus terrae]|uniref:Conserved hypothetical cytosolic protein n=1 Tax=Opitutus terrae (strain DSM 11246 / JCM 15787 / PB90-1) TaxID=452637 RepID=B1ZS69_OPITP|nr:zinc ribbon domain-containing protein [Opitutus terrae]ACB75668.1 conserved hypothetical cytosolic protein [Opitutus terrae PB90-1]